MSKNEIKLKYLKKIKLITKYNDYYYDKIEVIKLNEREYDARFLLLIGNTHSGKHPLICKIIEIKEDKV